MVDVFLFIGFFAFLATILILFINFIHKENQRIGQDFQLDDGSHFCYTSEALDKKDEICKEFRKYVSDNIASIKTEKTSTSGLLLYDVEHILELRDKFYAEKIPKRQRAKRATRKVQRRPSGDSTE